MNLRYLFFGILVFILMTVLTQVGGIVYLLSSLLSRVVLRKRRLSFAAGRALKLVLFGSLYIAFTLFLIPLLARTGGRIPLPWRATAGRPLAPRNIVFCLANRHYVQPELAAAVAEVSRAMAADYPGIRLRYLDGGFPFGGGFPLLPHLSHGDGRKLDLTFLYRDRRTGRLTPHSPSWFGYGGCEKPRPGETDQPARCAAAGYWQYNLLCRLTDIGTGRRLAFDEPANTQLLRRLARHPNVGKIFIEPHLRQRLGLGNLKKLRFHGCHAVRHDDHLHVQL